MDTEVRDLWDTFERLDADAAATLDGLRDPALDRVTEDGRTVRQTLYDLIDAYRQRTEQLLWTKWGQGIPRSEATRAVADLCAARARFAAYFADLGAERLDVASAPAEGASSRDVILAAADEERRSLDLIRKALGS